MLQHFSKNETSILCCRKEEVRTRISQLSQDDLDAVKSLPSIQKIASKNRLDDQFEVSSIEDAIRKYTYYAPCLIFEFITKNTIIIS